MLKHVVFITTHLSTELLLSFSVAKNTSLVLNVMKLKVVGSIKFGQSTAFTKKLYYVVLADMN
ncbi:hypothetical protein B481_2594 [Planococcus halocryophilus Or1]|uniref:Uncharacterized protein n=1 Tax=Planococcus halocryophilus TaxID=1215089 RepID=A0A1C7DST5_9BACL|nr:hypothetical protein BBI08_10430 [Planococcus halocryophilus]EMF46018.1 hypothetical protein B481_2594 [Planococcus halocryophilus Or1]